MSWAKKNCIIAGDGIGKEVMPEGVRVMEAAASKFGLDIWRHPQRPRSGLFRSIDVARAIAQALTHFRQRCQP